MESIQEVAEYVPEMVPSSFCVDEEYDLTLRSRCHVKSNHESGVAGAEEDLDIDDSEFAQLDEQEMCGNYKEPPPYGFRPHHSGPMRIEYNPDRAARRKTFSSRKTTLLKSAESLAIITGARVSLHITAESGRKYVYESHPRKTRNVKLQVGRSSFNSLGLSQPSRYATNRPKRAGPPRLVLKAAENKRISRCSESTSVAGPSQRPRQSAGSVMTKKTAMKSVKSMSVATFTSPKQASSDASSEDGSSLTPGALLSGVKKIQAAEDVQPNRL